MALHLRRALSRVIAHYLLPYRGRHERLRNPFRHPRPREGKRLVRAAVHCRKRRYRDADSAARTGRGFPAFRPARLILSRGGWPDIDRRGATRRLRPASISDTRIRNAARRMQTPAMPRPDNELAGCIPVVLLSPYRRRKEPPPPSITTVALAACLHEHFRVNARPVNSLRARTLEPPPPSSSSSPGHHANPLSLSLSLSLSPPTLLDRTRERSARAGITRGRAAVITMKRVISIKSRGRRAGIAP